MDWSTSFNEIVLTILGPCLILNLKWHFFEKPFNNKYTVYSDAIF